MTEKRYIGADIGGTYIKLGIVTDAGEVSMRREIPVCGRGTVMETLMSGVDELLNDAGLEAKDLRGIGVSSAGCIDSANGCVAENGGNVPGWSFASVTRPLEDAYGIPASIANDGNCVALAEAWIGAAKGCSNVLCVVLGTGIGGGIISGGRLVEGRHGFGGEIGHFPTHAEKTIASDDWSSHYETHASTRALVLEAQKTGKGWSGGREIFDAAASGDDDACAVLDAWIREIAAGITGLVHIFDPEIVLIGGGVSAQQKLLIEPLREKVLGMVVPDFAGDLEFGAAELGNNAGMVGAVKYFIDHAEGR